jgi:hypothetical protein
MVVFFSDGGENAATTDKELSALEDTGFQPHTWDELKQIIGVATSTCLRHLHVRNI